MDFDREYDLENAGIDALDYSLMDDEERAEALRDAGLDPDDYDGIEFDDSFEAWSALQNSGVNLWQLDLMDEDEKREALENAGIDIDDYEGLVNSDSSFDPRSMGFAPQYHDQASQKDDRSAIPPKRPPMVYHLCSVVFPGSNREYSYSVNRLDLVSGDIVMVPVGEDNKLTAAKVVSVGEYTAETAPYPIERIKLVVRKATASESEAFAPKEIPRTPPQTAASYEYPKAADRTAAYNGHPLWWVIAAVVVLVLLVSAGQRSKPSTTWNTYGSARTSGSSYSSSKLSTPTCPPVNRERAMTREEAERLKGTGYHNTRPNSSAETSALRAAQVRCKNCGYHSDNGSNSLCDYCAWMESYGGGLPSAKAPDVTPPPTQKPRPRQTTKPSTDNDPYHAGDYAHPDDFYYDYYDDFVDYEEAEEYWERHH